MFDLSDGDMIADYISVGNWSAIVNCAAYTAVDQAEVDTELATAINAGAPAVIAATCARVGIPLVHISTDYVFNGRRTGFYEETDGIDPIGIYAKTKAEGERAVQAADGIHAIVRTAWVVSEGPKNFLTTMLRLAEERDEIRIVDDQVGCPTGAEDVAHAALKILNQIDGRRGIWHCVNGGEASWFKLAQHIFEINRAYGGKTPRTVPISSAEFPTAAHRPVNSRLSTTKLARDFGIEMRPWQDAVEDIIDRIHSGRTNNMTESV